MTDKKKIITNLQKALNSLDVTSDLRLVLIQIIEYLQEEPAIEDLGEYINELSKQFPDVSFAKLSRIAVRVAKWQEKQDQSTIELAEDHAYFAGSEAMREKILKEIEEAYKKGGVIEAMKIIQELKK